MPVLEIGGTAIAWSVRHSAKATKKRIVVTPDGVEVVVPEGTAIDGKGGIDTYVQSKRRWIYDTVKRIEECRPDDLQQHYSNGAKLLYRGRRLILDIQPADVDGAEIEYRTRFHVRVPRGLGDEQCDTEVRTGLIKWMKEHALRDARHWANHYSKKIGVEPAGVRLGDQKSMWGSCGRDGILRINWRLVQAPASAMEYVVAHEVCHLVERNHTDRFWGTLGEAVPDWADRKALLERWERDQMIEGREV